MGNFYQQLIFSGFFSLLSTEPLVYDAVCDLHEVASFHYTILCYKMWSSVLKSTTTNPTSRGHGSLTCHMTQFEQLDTHKHTPTLAIEMPTCSRIWHKAKLQCLQTDMHNMKAYMFYLNNGLCIYNHIQWNLSITTNSKIKFITCDLFSNVFWWRLKEPIYTC